MDSRKITLRELWATTILEFSGKNNTNKRSVELISSASFLSFGFSREHLIK